MQNLTIWFLELWRTEKPFKGALTIPVQKVKKDLTCSGLILFKISQNHFIISSFSLYSIYSVLFFQSLISILTWPLNNKSNSSTLNIVNLSSGIKELKPFKIAFIFSFWLIYTTYSIAFSIKKFLFSFVIFVFLPFGIKSTSIYLFVFGFFIVHEKVKLSLGSIFLAFNIWLKEW